MADYKPPFHISNRMLDLVAAIMKELGLKSRETFRKNYMNPAIEMGAVRVTLPDKPNSKNQRYVKI